MSISTIRVREQFDYALQNNQVCPNMLLMSIAYLVYQIDYNKNVSDETVYTNYLEAERKKIAECAIAHGIPKVKIAEIYNWLSKKDTLHRSK